MRQLRIVIATAIGGLCQSAFAQCEPEWTGFEPNVWAQAVAVWDEDGPGPGRPVLVVGDSNVPSFGGYYRGRIKTYDGRAWKSIGTPFAMRFSGWFFREIAAVYTSGVDSPQPGLYVAGQFDEAGGQPAESLAYWDGTAWSSLASAPGYGRCLVMYDEDDVGPDEERLFIGGGFVEVNGIQAPGVVRWDGTDFTQLGGGLAGRFPTTPPHIQSMVEFDDDGPGPRKSALYVGGSFAYAGGQPMSGIARWDGTNWESLGSKTTDSVRALAVFDADGPGPERPMLYAGGGFTFDPGRENISYLARWDGQTWSRMPGWIGAGGVSSLCVFDDDRDGPNQPALFVSGFFKGVGGVQMNYIAKWDGDKWHPLGTGFTGFTGAVAYDMQVYDEDNDPTTPDGLYFAGVFPLAGGIPTLGFARWGCENPICYADCDESSGLGKLDIFDFLCFQQSFVTNDPYACNCDVSTGDYTCDIFDFLCFQSEFVSGCP